MDGRVSKRVAASWWYFLGMAYGSAVLLGAQGLAVLGYRWWPVGHSGWLTQTRLLLVFLSRACLALLESQFCSEVMHRQLRRSHFKSTVLSLLLDQSANDDRITNLQRLHSEKARISR